MALLGGAIAAHSPIDPAIRVCYETETPSQLCYTAPNNIPKDVLIDDFKFIASYLRSYGAQIRTGRLFNMAAADTPDCGECVSVYAHGTAQAFAKHINNTVNSGVHEATRRGLNTMLAEYLLMAEKTGSALAYPKLVKDA
ncbi:hypothetical protein LZ31DRAFT_544519 [Colletotrichum somersetense]|nr:hypothetical protein LZ31DRAFT_544519 [Colletotrichum somersetense]